MNNQQNKSIPIEQGDILPVVVWKIMQDGNWYSDIQLWDIIQHYGFTRRSLTAMLVKHDAVLNWFDVKYEMCERDRIHTARRKIKYYKLLSTIPMPLNIAKPNTKYVARLDFIPEVKTSESLSAPASVRVFTNMVATLTRPKLPEKLQNINYLKSLYEAR